MSSIRDYVRDLEQAESPKSGAPLIPDLSYAEPQAEPAEPPKRVQILHEGARLTNGDRDKEYGPPAINLAASGELKAVMRKHMARDISSAELEALDMVMTKIGRVITGNPKEDTYVDGSAYFAIAGEIALCPD